MHSNRCASQQQHQLRNEELACIECLEVEFKEHCPRREVSQMLFVWIIACKWNTQWLHVYQVCLPLHCGMHVESHFTTLQYFSPTLFIQNIQAQPLCTITAEKYLVQPGAVRTREDHACRTHMLRFRSMRKHCIPGLFSFVNGTRPIHLLPASALQLPAHQGDSRRDHIITLHLLEQTLRIRDLHAFKPCVDAFSRKKGTQTKAE